VDGAVLEGPFLPGGCPQRGRRDSLRPRVRMSGGGAADATILARNHPAPVLDAVFPADGAMATLLKFTAVGGNGRRAGINMLANVSRRCRYRCAWWLARRVGHVRR